MLLAAWVIPALLVMLCGGLVAAGSADARLPLTQCEDGVDNDNDSKIDSPWDPGCANNGATDNSEADPVPPAARTECSDGAPNDADLLTDFPLDPQCRSAGDLNEGGNGVTQCWDHIDNAPADGAIDYLFDPKCLWAADPFEVTRACSDGIDNDVPGDGFADFPADVGCADQNDNNETNLPQCNDGRDNDGNGSVDFGPGPRDPGCDSATDTTEASARSVTQCSDGVDNDGDNRVDYPNDPGCTSRADTDEADPPVPPACADGIDNDGDLRIDLADPGCSSASDNDEFHTITFITPQGQVVSRQPLLTPFPIVRMRGASDSRGVRVTLLSVRAPPTATVSIYCTGPSCLRKRVVIQAGKALVRVRPYERRLRNGTILKIYVTKPGFVGKYTRFRLLRNRLPLRADRCVTRPGTRPHSCPET